MYRRRALASIGTAIGATVAGCSALSPESGVHQRDRDADVGCSTPANPWPAADHDAGHSGAAPDVQGPTADASLEFRSRVADTNVAAPAIVDGRAFVPTMRRTPSGDGTEGPAFLAVDIDDGAEAWHVELDVAFTPVTVECGTAFCSRGGRTTAHATDDGERFWRHDVGTNITEAAPVVVDETVYVVDSRQIHALDSVTGEQRLQSDQQGTISALAADRQGPVVTVGSQPTSIRALDPSDGSPDWTATVGTSFTPIVLGDDRVYVVEQEEGLVAFDRTTGDRVWSRNVGKFAYHRPAVSEGVVYVTGTNDPEVVALDAADGGNRWQGEVDPGGATVGPVVAGGTLYIAAARFGITDLYAFDAESGDLQYRQRYPAEIASPLAVGAGGAYFLGDELQPRAQWPDHPRTRRLCVVQ